jgi:hypothetical protein
LEQAGVKNSFVKLTDLEIRGEDEEIERLSNGSAP